MSDTTTDTTRALEGGRLRYDSSLPFVFLTAFLSIVTDDGQEKGNSLNHSQMRRGKKKTSLQLQNVINTH